MDDLLSKYLLEINGQNQKSDVNKIEQNLGENIEELSKNRNFYKLPLTNIFSVLSKINFIETDDYLELLKTLIRNTIESHKEEKETLLLLENINTSNLMLSYEETLSLLNLFTNCSFLVNFCNICKEDEKNVEVDYQYELQCKEKEIISLKETIQKQKQLILDPDVFDAVKKGDLDSVQWCIERNIIDPKTIVDKNNDSLLNVASSYGHLSIVQYLIEECHVNINFKGYYEKTPLHNACECNQLSIVKYLISKGADKKALSINGKTPMYYAKYFSYNEVVDFLIQC